MSGKNSFMQVELKQQYDVINQSYEESRTVNYDIDAILKGAMRTIGTTEWCVLNVIACYVDIEGQSFPSQRRIAEITGLSLPTVNKAVNRLLETEINGVPVLSREFETVGSKKKYSVYRLNVKKTVNDESELKVVFQKSEDGQKPKNSKDYAMMFKYLYEKEYEIPYSINWRRETSMIKNKLVQYFSEEDIIKMLEYVVKNYRTKWASARYPYPTITMICSWLGNTAIQLMKQEQNKEQEEEALMEMTEEYLEADYKDFDTILG